MLAIIFLYVRLNKCASNCRVNKAVPEQADDSEICWKSLEMGRECILTYMPNSCIRRQKPPPGVIDTGYIDYFKSRDELLCLLNKKLSLF